MTLVLVDGDAPATLMKRVPQGEARLERTLRDMIFDHPTIVPVHEIDPSYGRLFTVAKELTLPSVGFVDVVLADERGRLVVIECKLWRNPQARREVVGQILDYAREFSRYSYEDLQRQISVATRRQGNVLYQLARDAGSNLDEAACVDRVSRDLTAGRFLLLVVGDGITEGTRRIGEYLHDQPGLAFEFGMIEMAEYRLVGPDGLERTIFQPRVLTQTTVIERHVIRIEVPGLVLETAEPDTSDGQRTVSAEPSGAALAWRGFVERFVAETVFDDPGQPAPRSGGNGWIRIALPESLYVNIYRSSGKKRIGAEISFPKAEGRQSWDALLADRAEIDREFVEAGLNAPEWHDRDIPFISLVKPSGLPWDAVAEEVQRAWMARAANQYVNSFRPRLQRIAELGIG